MLRMGRVQEVWLIKLPASLPFVFTGVKLSIVYSFIAVIGGEFLLSGTGFGYQIAFAYNNFDNQTMYGLMRSEEHTSELQPLMRISYAVFCLKKKKQLKDK